MPYKVDAALMLLAVGEFSVGVLGNTFIGLVNIVGWIKTRKMAPLDLILTSLAVSRLFLLCAILLDCFLLTLCPHLYEHGTSIMKITDFLWTLTNHSSVWLAGCLSVFYFVKIANFSHPLFLWMKWRVDRAVLGALLGCLLLSVCVSLPATENLNKDFRQCLKARRNRNFTLKCRANKIGYASLHISLNVVMLFPFAVSLVVFFLLILSLWRHKRTMQLHVSPHGDPRTQAHVGAMKAIISFLLLFLAYCLSFLIATSSYFMPETELAAVCGELIALIYPSSHSFILILGNNKLRQTSKRVLWKLKYCLKGRTP
ncbi:taste receptor type 2 member 7-like [Perognathus longimembris pacificus]|uniref:taste receptor type 2 member 7-like n=1 Tax=Perognathus longimembris pacificus TaxID=214514 RepID=UPI002019938F|nr:taste receptor type 2 member 7-like [Perognathus longimembris pacificus]